MALGILKEIRKIYSAVNADEVRELAHHPLRVGIQASSDESYRALEAFLVPLWLDDATRAEALPMLSRFSDHGDPANFDFVLAEPGSFIPRNGVVFDPANPEITVNKILTAQEDLELAIARNFQLFRRPVADKIIQRVSRENAFFSLVTALPNVVPSILDLPWAVGEFATDTAFLTMNQVRMALQMAAAHNRDVGYKQQKMEIGAIAAGAFGWRAIARELVGKIPLGGGLIPKAAVAYAGTYVVGLGLEKINRNGDGLSKWEKREAYVAAFEKGKQVALEMAPSFTRPGARRG